MKNYSTNSPLSWLWIILIIASISLSLFLLLPLILIAWFIVVSPKPILCSGGEGQTTPPLSTDEAWIDNIEQMFVNRKDTDGR